MKVLVTRFGDVPYEKYLAMVDALREAGIVSSVYLGTKKFGKQLDFAIKDGYTHVITMGGDEMEKGIVRLKNLATREESELTFGDALQTLTR